MPRAPRIYLDWNATTPPTDDVVHAMADAARDAWGNPSSVHGEGRRARGHVEDARAAVAALAGVDPRDVILVSGGTEANNLALRSAFAPRASAGSSAAPLRTLITSRLEHPSVTRVAEALEAEGAARVRWLAVDAGGRIDLADLARALDEPGAHWLALQAVQHETGVIQPVSSAIAACHARGVGVHVDAVQAFGKVDEIGAGADSRALAAHKIRGPKGIGALVLRGPGACALPASESSASGAAASRARSGASASGARSSASAPSRLDVVPPRLDLAPILVGGAQERGLRPGTLDPIAAAGLAVAARHARTGAARYARLAPLRDRLERALVALVASEAPAAPAAGDAGAAVNGAAPRAPHVTNVSFAGWSGAELVAALDLEGIAVASGSACSAGTVNPSPGIRAFAGDARAISSVRVSLGDTTTDADVDAAIAAFARVLRRVSAGGAGAAR